MHVTRSLLLLTALSLAGCGAQERAVRPLDTPSAVPAAAVAPSLPLAATSQALIDTPILDTTPDRPPAMPLTPSTPVAGDRAPTPVVEQPPEATSIPLPAPVKPVRITISDIDMDRPLLAVGLGPDTLPIVPKHDAGWYESSAAPGQGENIVLWGHALRFKDEPQIPAPFGQLQKLKLNTKVVLYNQSGKAYNYRVTQQVWATPDQVQYILPQGEERLTMISCIGDKVMTKHGIDMTHRLVTIAEPER
jgi:LPXTG-site transpeptidase (sortase) family protein